MRGMAYVIMVAAMLAAGACTGAQALDLHPGEGSDWHFLRGAWAETEGVITPPDEHNLHSRAFYLPKAFSDTTVEFDYNANYREGGTGSAGVIIRAKDVNHFYFVYFPWGAQQLRAGHFWAAIAEVNGDGYLRNIKMSWVPGVPSETDRWFHVKVTASGPNISVTVDGRKALNVTDETYKSGRVGLAGFGWYSFRNVQVSGTEIKPAKWDTTMEIPNHTFVVGLEKTTMPTGCMAPNGDILIAAMSKMVRSTDKGRTWSQPVELPANLGVLSDYASTMLRTSKGRLMVMVYRKSSDATKPIPEILISESTDNGHTWSEPVPSQVAPDWPEHSRYISPYGPLVETEDGTLIRFMYGRTGEETRYNDIFTWGSLHAKGYAIRSTDGGKSWSSPIEIDQPGWTGRTRGEFPGSLDFTEPTGVAMGNKVTVLIRPIYSQMMWQCWTTDAGATWDAATRTTFPGYAQTMIGTKTGAIVCGHRYPHYSLNISHDDGLNWDEGTVIDYTIWAMGVMVELEPGTILCTYMSYAQDGPIMGQIIRVGPDGPKPL